jgi:hypothetical protein
MPPRGAVLTPTEVLLAREACEPLLSSITDRLLRGGLAAFVEFRHRYAAECQRAMSAAGKKSTPTNTISGVPSSSSSPSPAATTAQKNTEAGRRVARRINPEGLKSVFAQSGVLFSPEEYRTLLIAYSDAVGFVLAEDLLADLHPCRHAPLEVIHTSTSAVAEGLFSELPILPGHAASVGDNGSGSNADFSAVTVDSVRATLSVVFDPVLSNEEEAAPHAADSAALASLQAGAEATFLTEVYAHGAVPAEDVVAFVVLALQQYPQVAPVVVNRLLQAPPLTVAPPPSSRNAAGGSVATTRDEKGSGLDGSALFSIRHNGDRTQRKFEYYRDSDDRRDEWIHGRREADARPNYMRHAVGYGGHLPEYQYRFGRTFHVIEEDLPQLTKPKAPLEPVPPDWYGKGVELKDSRMNAHHYRLA